MFARFAPPRRRGVTMVSFVVMIPVLLGFVGLAVDVGMSTAVKADLQRTADAAALAAAQELGGSDLDAAKTAARATVLQYAGLNPVLGNHLIVVDEDADVVFGQATLDMSTGKVTFLPNEDPPGAVRVTVHVDLPYTFARVLGFNSRTISASATAATGPRDFVLVIDCSGSMTKQSVEEEVAEDLDALGIPYENGKAKSTALDLTYDGTDPEFAGVYEINEMFLPPAVRIQPLKATKDAAAFAVQVVQDAGYDDLIAAVAYASDVAWVELLTTDYARVRAKLRGATKYGGTKLHFGIEAARVELLSERSRVGTDKVIVLMTDGKSNSDAALAEAQLSVDEGMTIHCVGLGTNVDYDLLNTIAALGGGIALYVDNTTDPSVYGPALEEVFQSVASEVEIMLID